MKKTYLCSKCKDKPKINTSYCAECQKEYYRKYRKENPEKVKSKNDRYKTNEKYKIKRDEYLKKYVNEHKEKLNEKSRNFHRKNREDVLQHYGQKCVCCCENNKEFLAIDHINGEGRKHRNSITGGIYKWLIRNNFPEGFQILCHNCNSSKSYYGYCPHQLMKNIMPAEIAQTKE